MQVGVIIPVYKEYLTPLEEISFRQICKMLSAYPLIIVHPQKLDPSFLIDYQPSILFETFDDRYFDGLSGYNRMMLSIEFYQRFANYKYILIAQLDSFIFKNNLNDFCQHNYDYIGAPWIKKWIYHTLPVACFVNCKKALYKVLGKPCSQQLYGKIGNGGLSLRKVQSHITALEQHKERRDYYLLHFDDSSFYNEDVFFAMEVPEFNFPPLGTALAFSFERSPQYCYKLTNNQLPFGCHDWWHRRRISFWKDFIEFPKG